jgi:4-amino-4-deoxy-L-arabinose transferase-like glycosyltransferase
LRDTRSLSGRLSWIAAAFVAAVYLHNALPHLTMLPRVNVDEPWLLERAYQVLTTGRPRQPMYGLERAYLLQAGYAYLCAPWIGSFGLGMFQARLLSVILGAVAVACTGSIASYLLGRGAGIAAALFLATDSNFLGTARDARTDIPAVAFASLALLLFLVGRRRRRPAWFAASGAATGVAILCHGNCYWVGIILFVWYLIDHWRRPLTASAGWAYLAGLALTLGPYIAIVVRYWTEFQSQLASFAGDRVPGPSPSFVWRQILREPERYRGWYFGLVTSDVPNPVLWSFRVAIVLGAVVLIVRLLRARDEEEKRRLWFAATLAFLPVIIFAGFINNKALVYMSHLLIGFAVAAAAAVQATTEALARAEDRRSLLAAAFVFAFGAAAIAYYEKWYHSALRSELVPYEQTEATLRALVPAGPKLLVASPHFWVPYGADPAVSFMSYTGTQPDATLHLPRASSARPTYLVIDETQWLHDLEPTASETTPAWRQTWIAYLAQRCDLDRVALGTAYGTLALFRCEHGSPGALEGVRLIGRDREVSPDAVEWTDTGPMRTWIDYVDPRRTPANQPPHIERTSEGVRVSGGNWPGVERYIDVTPGQRYLITYTVEGARAQDLLYIGRWERPEVTSLSGASAAGFPAPLAVPDWFPSMRGFVATSARVRLLLYSEAPRSDFRVRSVTLTHLR